MTEIKRKGKRHHGCGLTSGQQGEDGGGQSLLAGRMDATRGAAIFLYALTLSSGLLFGQQSHAAFDGDDAPGLATPHLETLRGAIHRLTAPADQTTGQTAAQPNQAHPDQAAQIRPADRENLLRVINDPGGHAVWLLKRDPSHPAGPGQLERIEMTAYNTLSSVNAKAVLSPANALHPHPLSNSDFKSVSEVDYPLATPIPTPVGETGVGPTSLSNAKELAANLAPIMRAGDRIYIEQHTASIEAHLMATALSPAREGETLMARLAVGGKQLHVVALAPGRAGFEPDVETHTFGESQ